MQCPECGGKTEVTHNRSFPEYIRRRRVCRECGHVMTTYEVEKPPGERYPMGKRATGKKKGIPKEVCCYNDGVMCDKPKESRDCGGCGWKKG